MTYLLTFFRFCLIYDAEQTYLNIFLSLGTSIKNKGSPIIRKITNWDESFQAVRPLRSCEWNVCILVKHEKTGEKYIYIVDAKYSNKRETRRYILVIRSVSLFAFNWFHETHQMRLRSSLEPRGLRLGASALQMEETARLIKVD